jgi:hypothetical protein
VTRPVSIRKSLLAQAERIVAKATTPPKQRKRRRGSTGPTGPTGAGPAQAAGVIGVTGGTSGPTGTIKTPKQRPPDLIRQFCELRGITSPAARDVVVANHAIKQLWAEIDRRQLFPPPHASIEELIALAEGGND